MLLNQNVYQNHAPCVRLNETKPGCLRPTSKVMPRGPGILFLEFEAGLLPDCDKTSTPPALPFDKLAKANRFPRIVSGSVLRPILQGPAEEFYLLRYASLSVPARLLRFLNTERHLFLPLVPGAYLKTRAFEAAGAPRCENSREAPYV